LYLLKSVIVTKREIKMKSRIHNFFCNIKTGNFINYVIYIISGIQILSKLQIIAIRGLLRG
jgi:hypothetical protein